MMIFFFLYFLSNFPQYCDMVEERKIHKNIKKIVQWWIIIVEIANIVYNHIYRVHNISTKKNFLSIFSTTMFIFIVINCKLQQITYLRVFTRCIQSSSYRINLLWKPLNYGFMESITIEWMKHEKNVSCWCQIKLDIIKDI